MNSAKNGINSASEQQQATSKPQNIKADDSRACATNRSRFMCLSPKVLLGLAAVGLGIWAIAPGAAAAALPILVLAACPLSMLLMMHMMSKKEPQARTGQGQSEQASPAPDSEPSLADLKARLAALGAEQEKLTREISEEQVRKGR